MTLVFKREKQNTVLKKIDLARAKSEALDNIYSLFKQSIKSCNAKRRRYATPQNCGKEQQWI